MSGEGKHTSRISQHLPLRKPDKDLWPGIEAGIAAPSGASLADKLPVHKVRATAWSGISKGLPHAWYSFRKPYTKAALAGILILMLLIFWYGNQRENNKIQIQKELSVVKHTSDKNKIPIKNQTQKHSETSPDVQQTSNQITQEDLNINHTKTLTVPVSSDIKPRQTQGYNENPMAEQNAQQSLAGLKDELSSNDAPDLPNALPAVQKKSSFAQPYNPIKPQARAGLTGKHQTANYRQNELSYETGLFVQPSFIRNISTIDQDWYFSKAVGFSMSMLSKDLIFETGLSYSEMEVEDKINWDYYAFVFVGTLINTSNYEWQEVVNEQGDTIMQRVYTVTFIDVYDSVFVAEEQHDRIKFSSLNIPISLGYRFRDKGHFYYDIKAGLDLMIVTGKIIPAKTGNIIDIKYLEYQNSLAEKNTVKWKYHLALGAGMRLGESMTIFAEPTLWWYPEGVRTAEAGIQQNPFEAGVKLGVKWRW